MLSVPLVKQHPKEVSVTCFFKNINFSLPGLHDLLPQEGHMLKLNSLAVFSVWLCLNHRKRSQPEYPPPNPKGAQVV